MSEPVFWVWNGWGVLFTGVIALWQFFHIFVTVKFGSGTPLRNMIALAMPIALVLTFITSGWIAGLLALPIGMTIGLTSAMLLIPRP